jgi:hypothetical protein
MNDHHFSYPVVVPLQGVTISGHSNHSLAPALSPLAMRPPHPVARHAVGAPPVPASAAPPRAR